MRNNFRAAARGRFINSSGDPIHIIYQPKVMPDGTINLVKTGEENTDQKIESYRQSTELSVIISRFLEGDEAVLHRYEPVYADLTQLPKDYRGVMDAALNAEAAFSALPVDLRKIWSNDWRQWMAEAGTEDWVKNMKPVLDPDPQVQKDEVKVDES